MRYSCHVLILKTCEIYTSFYILLPSQFCITVYKWLRIDYHELRNILQIGRFTARLGAGQYELCMCGHGSQNCGSAVATEN